MCQKGSNQIMKQNITKSIYFAKQILHWIYKIDRGNPQGICSFSCMIYIKHLTLLAKIIKECLKKKNERHFFHKNFNKYHMRLKRERIQSKIQRKAILQNNIYHNIKMLSFLS